MHLRRWLALAGAASAAGFAACDLALAPKWDADWYLPLTTQAIHLNVIFPVPIPAGASGNVSFPPQSQSLGASVGGVLTHVVTDPARAHSVLTVTFGKTTPVTVQDTLFVASSTAALNVTDPATIVLPVTLAATDLTKTDSVTVSPASITMLQTAATLWVQVRGRVTNPGSSAIPITSADSISIKPAMTLRIAISGCPSQRNPDKTCP